jgi:hypothetical protein
VSDHAVDWTVVFDGNAYMVTWLEPVDANDIALRGMTISEDGAAGSAVDLGLVIPSPLALLVARTFAPHQIVVAAVEYYATSLSYQSRTHVVFAMDGVATSPLELDLSPDCHGPDAMQAGSFPEPWIGAETAPDVNGSPSFRAFTCGNDMQVPVVAWEMTPSSTTALLVPIGRVSTWSFARVGAVDGNQILVAGINGSFWLAPDYSIVATRFVWPDSASATRWARRSTDWVEAASGPDGLVVESFDGSAAPTVLLLVKDTPGDSCSSGGDT